MTSFTIDPGDGTADLAALINAALADPAVTHVILGEGLFLLHSPIFVPSGKTLTGAGRDLTMLKAAEDFTRPNPGEADGVVNSDVGAIGITLSDFSIDANKLMPDGTRMVGCFMRDAEDFTIARVDVANATAYGHFAQGDANTFTSYASGSYEDCTVLNSQVCFEQMYCDGVTLTDCRAGDGDGDLIGTYFHPLTGSKNITYLDCTASGYASVGFDVTANVYAQETIRIIDCSVEMLGAGAAIVVVGEHQTLGLELTGSSFVAHGNSAALLYGSVGTAFDCYFQGELIGIAFFDSPHGLPAVFTVTASHVLGLADPIGGAAAFGVSTDGGTIVWDGGSIEARGPAVISVSGPLTVTPGTLIIVDGFDVLLTYMEQGPPKAVAPHILLPEAAFGSFAGGSLVVDFIAKNRPDDAFGIADQGSGAGQIGLAGAEVLYGGTVIGTMSGGAAGTDLRIDLGAAATGEAVQALMRAITFSNGSEDPGSASRLLDIIVTDGAGTSAKVAAAVVLIPFNNAPLIDLADPPGDAILAYSENDAPSSIAPAATVSDVDSPDFSGGALIVSFAANGDADDMLSIIDQGSGPGQIGVAGDIVSWSGIAIGTLAGGLGGAPLTIAFNQQASVAAVQALTRAVAFSNVSDTPSVEPRTLLFTLTDGDGAEGIPTSAVVELQAVEDPAVAADDQASVFEDGVLSAGVTGNDTDPDGPAIGIVAVNGEAAAVGAEIVLASGALLTMRADGSYDYDPNGRFDALASSASGAVNSTATDSFTYALAGGGTGTVTIIVHGVASPEDELTGGSGADVMTGDVYADLFVLDAGGDDEAAGLGGNDFFYYGAAWTAADRADGGAGTDTIGLIGSYDLVLGAETMIGIERLALYSGLYLPGNGPSSYRIATDDSNVAAGAELTVLAASLGAGESLVFNGAAEKDGRFVVHGGGGADTIVGGAKNDYLIGNAGDDLIYGLGGVDSLIGGLGADQLRGGAASDSFIYQSVAQSAPGEADRILDLQQIDRIELSAIDADTGAAGDQAFDFIGAAAFSGIAGELRAEISDGVWLVEGDIDGDGTADLSILVVMTDPVPLVAEDFIL